jgi:hypothetical protein
LGRCRPNNIDSTEGEPWPDPAQTFWFGLTLVIGRTVEIGEGKLSGAEEEEEAEKEEEEEEEEEG